MRPSSRRRTLSWVALVALLAGAGTLHLVVPRPYRSIVPKVIGHADLVVLLSGLAELGCAALIAVPRTRRIGGWAAAALFVAVFPANVQMAIDAGVPGAGAPFNAATVTWLRLPLQLPLVLWAATIGRHRAED